jgi:transposase
VVNGTDQDAVKRRQRAQQVALFRYQLICPALGPALSTKQRGKLVRGIAGRSHDGPFGGQVRYSRDTLDRWIRRYRAGGFDALSPSIRQAGTRIDAQVFELAAALKRENPGRTAAQVARILRASTGWAPSESTLLRHFHRLELMGPAAGQAVVFGRFEADAPNDRWVGDALHGPKVAGRKVYLFAFLDDHSRWRWVTGSGSPRTPCGWRQRWNPRSPPAASPDPHTSTTAAPSLMNGCSGPAESSGSGSSTAPHTDPKDAEK